MNSQTNNPSDSKQMTNRNQIMENVLKIQDLIGLLTEKYHGNVVIGGSAALILHGLSLSRPINDIDIILYNPKDEQLAVLNTLKAVDSVNSSFGYGDRRVIKLLVNEVNVDIIVSHETLPSNLLLHPISSPQFKGLFIQSIDEVIKAKISYTLDKDERQLNIYRRTKDFADLLDLKNSNF